MELWRKREGDAKRRIEREGETEIWKDGEEKLSMDLRRIERRRKEKKKKV